MLSFKEALLLLITKMVRCKMSLVFSQRLKLYLLLRQGLYFRDDGVNMILTLLPTWFVYVLGNK